MIGLRLALTGGIGSGKSTVAALFVAHGAVLIDADAISRALTQPGGTALPTLRKAFGGAVFDASGALDRTRLRDLVFANARAKAQLEGLLHPMIRREALCQADAAVGGAIVFDIPLLVESAAWRALAQRVLVVDCTIETQVQRVGLRPGWDASTARRVIAQQSTREARRAVADAVIFNDGIDLAALAEQVAQLCDAWGIGAEVVASM